MIAIRLVLALAAAIGAAALPSLAFAQRNPDPNCSDDRGVDRCSEEQQRRTRSLFGVRSIEEHQAAGDEVRRIFYVDGYGRDIVMIAFVRAPGRDPMVWVHHPEREGEGRPDPLQAPVPLAVWNEVIEGSRDFHRTFEEPGPARRPSAEEDGEITVCLHSWVYTIEAVDRPWPGRPAPIRRKTEDACQNGPGEVYAQRLDRLARSLFPHCAALDITHFRNDATALASCRILRGDRLAAAQVLNRAQQLESVQGPEDARMISDLFAYEATIDWAGEQHRAPGEAGAFWAARIPAGEGRALFYIHTVEGVDAGRVRLIGSLSRARSAESEERGAYETATVEQIWTTVNSSEWEIERATVGAWRPEPSD